MNSSSEPSPPLDRQDDLTHRDQDPPSPTPEPAAAAPFTGPTPEDRHPADSSDEFEGEADFEEFERETNAELTAWKDALRCDFEAWLDSIQEIPPPEDTPDPGRTPDLYSFYELLTATNAESRKANRRTAEAFSQWGDTLQRFDEDLRRLRSQLEHQAASRPRENALSRAHALVLVEMLDRLQRLDRAFQVTPPPSWWGNDKTWRQTWETQRQAFEILLSHFTSWLTREGISHIPALHQPFDPACMTAVATETDLQRPHHTVTEEISAGYRYHGELLRPAHVTVIMNPTPPATS